MVLSHYSNSVGNECAQLYSSKPAVTVFPIWLIKLLAANWLSLVMMAQYHIMPLAFIAVTPVESLGVDHSDDILIGAVPKSFLILVPWIWLKL